MSPDFTKWISIIKNQKLPKGAILVDDTTHFKSHRFLPHPTVPSYGYLVFRVVPSTFTWVYGRPDRPAPMDLIQKFHRIKWHSCTFHPLLRLSNNWELARLDGAFCPQFFGGFPGPPPSSFFIAACHAILFGHGHLRHTKDQLRWDRGRIEGLNENFDIFGFHDVAASFQMPTSPATPKNNRRSIKDQQCIYAGVEWFWREDNWIWIYIYIYVNIYV